MEPNTSTSPAAGTSLAAVLEHGEPSVRDPSLLSPAFSHVLFPSHVAASGSGSGSSSWYKQIPTSPAVATGNGSLSVHAHTTSLQSQPSSFPTADTFPMVGYDLFGNPEATADTPLPTLLGGQWEQGELSAMAVSVLLECPSPGMFGFASESAAWLSKERSSSFFFSPLSAGGLDDVNDEEEDGLYEDVIPSSIPGLNGGARSSNGHSKGKGTCFALEAGSWYNVFGSWGNSSPASFASGSRLGSSSDSPSFAPGSLGGGRSSRHSFALDSWGSSSGSHSFAPGSWGGGSSSSSPSFALGSWGSSRSSSPNFAGSVTSFDRSTPIDNYGSSSMTKVSIRRGKMPSTSGLPPLPKAAIRTRKGGPGIVFTDREMAIIVKDKKLQEQMEKYPKKVKRILYNREYSQVSKVRKVMHTKNLEQEIVTLQEERKSLYGKLKSLEEGSAALMAENKKMEILIAELEQQTMLKDVVREELKAEIETLKHQKLTNKPSTSRG